VKDSSKIISRFPVIQVILFIAVACLLIFAGVSIFTFGLRITVLALVIAAFLLSICALIFLFSEKQIPSANDTLTIYNPEDIYKTTVAIDIKGGKRLFLESRDPPRPCLICGEPIPIIRDRAGNVIFDSAFHCLKEACKEAWENRIK
jgi:hypothetical protein